MTEEFERMLRGMLAALLVMATYTGAMTIGIEWATYGTIALAALLAGWAYRGLRRYESRTGPPRHEGVTYAGFGDLPEVTRDEVFDPWLEDDVWAAASHRPLTIEEEATQAVQTSSYRDLLDRWDRELRELLDRWDGVEVGR